MAASYGKTLQLLTEFPDLFTTHEGPAVVLYATYRRWTIPEDSEAGRRIYGGQCRDVRKLIQSRMDQAILAGWERDLAEIAKVDQRVDDCTVTIDATPSLKTATLTGAVTLGQETHLLVIPFDDFTPEVLLGTA